MSELKVVDLFSGCGGLSYGLIRAGLPVSAAYDNWPDAVRVYNDNVPVTSRARLADLSEANTIRMLTSDADIVVGGPPCQDFSSSGKLIEGSRASLLYAFTVGVMAAGVPTVLIENVPRAINSPTYEQSIRLLQSAGYDVTPMIVDLSEYGVPQRRKRLFVVARLHPIDINFPKPQERISLRQWFGNWNSENHVYFHPTNYNRRGVYSMDEVAPTIRQIKRGMPANYVFHPNDKSTDRSDIRSLTTNERASLQTFHRMWSWDFTTETKANIMIANAVPPAVGELLVPWLTG